MLQSTAASIATCLFKHELNFRYVKEQSEPTEGRFRIFRISVILQLLMTDPYCLQTNVSRVILHRFLSCLEQNAKEMLARQMMR